MSGPVGLVGGWQDVAIAAGMVVFILSLWSMVRDDESRVAPVKGFAYGAGQFLIAAANFSLGLNVSAALLLVGGVLWWVLSVQSIGTV